MATSKTCAMTSGSGPGRSRQSCGGTSAVYSDRPQTSKREKSRENSYFVTAPFVSTQKGRRGMAEVTPEVEALLAGLSDKEFALLIAKTRAPDTREQLREIAARFVPSGALDQF